MDEAGVLENTVMVFGQMNEFSVRGFASVMRP